jgi:hypothetical protein
VQLEENCGSGGGGGGGGGRKGEGRGMHGTHSQDSNGKRREGRSLTQVSWSGPDQILAIAASSRAGLAMAAVSPGNIIAPSNRAAESPGIGAG